MANNLHFIKNVTHNGIQFLGQQIRDNKVVFDGMVVDLTQDTRGLKDVAQSLVDRKLAEYTDAPATHSSNFVNGAQEAVPVDAALGSGASPAADAVRQRENLNRGQTQPAAIQSQPQAPAQPQQSAPKQPTPEEVAAAAAAA